MKKRIVLLVLICALAGCEKMQKKETAEQIFQKYVSYWQQSNFDAMYDLLSPGSKEKITKESFGQKYEAIYSGIEAKQLKVEKLPASPPADASKTAGDKAQFRYQAEMATMAGPVEFAHQMSLVKDNNSVWGVDWNPSLIFPPMKDGDKVTAQTLKAPRGSIVDRSGSGLAINGTVTMVGLVPGELGAQAEQTKEQVAGMLKMTVDDINKELGASWVKPGYFVPVGPADSKMLQTLQGVPGVSFQEKGVRVYPLGEAAAHLTGYVRTINAEELAKLKDQGYGPDDKIGKAGLEQIFEARLKGKDGAVVAITDAKGNVKETLARREPQPGETIRVTIDSDLQRDIYVQFKGDAGAAAAIHLVSGDVLALVSSPSYDPNAFVQGLSAEKWNEWNSDPLKPLFNRFTKLYAPGSVFKTITAAAGLDAKVSSPDKVRRIDGLHWTKDASWGSYYVTRDRDVPSETMRDALVNSDNIFFAQEALDMGGKKFYDGVLPFGFGEKLPIPYPFQVATIANDGIKSDIQLADSAYGQGEVQMSVLHVALSYTPFANKGDLIAPVLLAEQRKEQAAPWKAGIVRPETAELIKQYLIQAVSDPKGYGHGAYIPGLAIAGKTGTAELKQKKGEDGQENGWFVEFNAGRPDLLVAIMVEDVKRRGGSSYVVAKMKPIFKKYAGSGGPSQTKSP
ncbi:penicillin-binding transpeptidase domain-containing protein [Paenibacillus hamazuiensis]|uniref:penicillin-binding transpeptidase domain-containing protein n=1 Tax=Paenibacillus hamazuiensis TaxID=2936508 RepID=UPI00200F101E|nr:penicillin-binding transpeptidase domain-containing protein [Paenibacillus hamazuiensis]